MSDARLEQLAREAEANPSDPGPWVELSSALLRAGRVDEAQEAAITAAVAGPEPSAEAVYTSRAPLAVLPASGGLTALVAASPTRAVAVEQLPFVQQPEPALHPERRVVAGFDHDLRRLGVLSLDDPDRRVRWFGLPDEEQRSHALAFNGPALYVGTNGERLLVRDLDDLYAGFWEAELPGEQFRWGKAIDAMLLDGSRLIAVDNIIMPKYSFVFDVQEPLRPSFQRAEDLGAHYTYERVHDAALGERHMAVLSSGGGRGGAYSFLAFYERESLSEIFHVAQRLRGLDTVGERDHSWHGVEMLGSLALVAAGIDGLGVIDVSQPHGDEPSLRSVPISMPDGAELVRVKRLAGREQLLLALGTYSPQQLAKQPWERQQPATVDYSLLGFDAL